MGLMLLMLLRVRVRRARLRRLLQANALIFTGAVLLAGGPRARAQTPQAAPSIFWASDPVQPNDTVLLAGEDLNEVDAVEVARLPDASPNQPAAAAGPLETWQTIVPLQKTARAIKFVLPAAWQNGVFACRLKAGAARSRRVLINAPTPWWMQADAGEDEAQAAAVGTPGGWLRIFGKCLSLSGSSPSGSSPSGSSPSGSSRILLRDKDGHGVWLKAAGTDGYALLASLPRDLKPGKYLVLVHNGCGGVGGVRLGGTLSVRAAQPWPAQVFNVMDFYGAQAQAEGDKTQDKGSPTPDRTEAIKAALARAKANGGGVVFFAPGKYAFQGELQVPPRTILKGAGEGTVAIRWGKGGFALDGGSSARRLQDADEAVPGSLISGSAFALEDLSLYLPRHYQTGIASGDGFGMQRVRVRVDRYWQRSGERENDVLMRIGSHCRVLDCDILAQGVAISFGRGRDEIIARNTIAAGKSHLALEHCDGAIVEDNQLDSLDPTAYINLANEGRNLYYARNTQRSLFAQQSDFSLTFDGNGSAYLGGASAAGSELTLLKEPKFPAWANESSELWQRAAACILDGRGAGQYRLIAANAGRKWQLERPFEVAPDASSVVSIIPFRGHVLVVGNRFEDANWVNMGYGSSFDVVCASNSLYRVGALLNLGLREPEGVHASWFVQYLHNDIFEGRTLEQSTGDERNPQIFGGTTTRFAIHRAQHFHADNSGSINIGGNACDAVVEHCRLDNEASRIVAEPRTGGVLLRDNAFATPSARYEGAGLSRALVVAR